jgi:hypothetical protein
MNQEQEQFLLECGKSYPEAMVALGYFRQLVQRQCKPVVEKRLKEVCEVLNVSRQSLSRPYPSEYVDPDRPVSTPSEYLSVGWQAKRADNLYLYFYLSWVRKPEDDSGPLGVAITIWVSDKGKREALAAELHRYREDVAFKDEPWVLKGRTFWLTMKEGDLPQLADKLNALAEYTIRFLESIKGIVRVRELLTP